MARFSRGEKYIFKSHSESKGIGYSIGVSTIANIKGIGLSYSHVYFVV